MKLLPNEHLLVGRWVLTNSVVRGDEVCNRIEALIKNELKKIRSSPVSGDWEVLFQNPADDRYWE